ncbi:SRPBCC family protein [Cognatiyoonia sp. IB215446]|uniref:SRPBCC family protein n=1 Tax=Cognatiyoonia sp. IB215446 TaxID=3097355 RepID=UPI002A0E3F39|nr:SRPBCC family protein [Cognatiyoonia sp. IB215446]MDX8347197.1 SRPBCC family protein [Cognatiyoonia sp. IB215446]
MKFSTREDIEAPIAFVFDRASDFDALEKRGRQYGAEISRNGDGPAQVGMAWDAVFEFRGRNRQMQVKLTQFTPPEAYIFETEMNGLTAVSDVTLVSLSPSRTRLAIGIDLRAHTLTARLLLQSMKLAKTKLTKRFKARVRDYAEDIEEAYRAQT